MSAKPAGRGPAPKRSSEAAGHQTKAERPDTIVLTGPVKAPPASSSWDPAIRRWYRSLGKSGQSHWYEPSDWELARLTAQEWTAEHERADGPRPAVLTALFGRMDALMTTESQRRRMRIEVERPRGEQEAEAEAEVMAQVARLAVANG